MPEVFSLDKLGPLPEPFDRERYFAGPEEKTFELFTADQMRAYAAAEVAKERERCALLCEKLAVDMQQESADRGCPFGELIPDGDEAAEMCAKAIRSQHD